MRRLFGRYVARGTRRAAGYGRRIADHTIVIADDSYRMSLTHVLAYPFICHLFSFSSLLLFFFPFIASDRAGRRRGPRKWDET